MRWLLVLCGTLMVATARADGGDAAPAWLQWLGWSDDGARYAVRAGTVDEQRRPGAPIDITRLDAEGRVEDALRVVNGVSEALKARRITVGPMVAAWRSS